MTSLFATHPATTATATLPRAGRSRTGTIALWATQLAVAAMFFYVGTLKLTGAPALVGLFDAIGVGQWLRYVTGTIEVGSALTLLVPSRAAVGALVLIPTMIAAIATHLFVVGGTPVPALILLIGSTAIAWARRDQLAGALAKFQ